MSYETIKTELRGAVGIITLNRPKQLNALNSHLQDEVCRALAEFDANAKVGAIVLTGGEKAFAAGADVSEMADLSYQDALSRNLYAGWDRMSEIRKPIIAAVAGYCLGGGCELAMACDFIVAADTAKFGQPEITLGILPGMGGTQRLARSVGKAKAMDLILTGRKMDAREAEAVGLVARVVPFSDLMEEAMTAAERIASYSKPVVALAKQSVARSFETTLAEGMRYERQAFWSTFGLDDQKEGMEAFIEKRTPNFKDR